MSSQQNDFIYYLRLVAKWKQNIVINVTIVTLFSIIISFLIPKIFRSTAVLMPPQSESDIGVLGAFSENLPLSDFLLPASDNSLSMIAILKSRTMMEDVIHKFDLIKLYDVENIEEAIEILTDDVEFEIEDEGTIRITFYVSTDWFHSDNQENIIRTLSSDVVNYFVERLNILNVTLNVEHASFQRIFIENRYNQNINDLQQAENKLLIFREKHNMISIKEQTTAAIKVATDLISRISINNVKLQTFKQTLRKDHPEIKLLETELSGLKAQLEELNIGKDGASLIPVFSDVPNLGLELGRLVRNVEVQNSIYIYLTQQYEDAKIQEARNTPTIQVLDHASKPFKKYKPRRLLLVITTFLITLLLNIMYLVAVDNYNTNKA